MQTRSISTVFLQTSFFATIAVAAAMIGAPPANAAVPGDPQIQDAVEDELEFDQAVAGGDIDVAVEGGWVTLSGSVETVLEKRRARALAGSVRGVIGVINEIRVDPDVFSKSAKELERDIESALTLNPTTERFEISVNANDDGHVRLSGTVDSWPERQVAERATLGVIGVKSVENLIAVEPAEQRTDPEIRNDVVAALRWNTLVRAPLIEVEVNDQKVTLSGSVRSLAERDFARDLAGVAGVTEVDASGLAVMPLDGNSDRFDDADIDVSDDAIREAVESAFERDPEVPDDIRVVVDGSKVILRGAVSRYAAKFEAAREARDIVGVSRVDNRIKVRPETPIEASAIARAIGRALRNDPVVESYEIVPLVDKGQVTLSGVVDTYFEKSRAEQVVGAVAGVRSVNNNLRVTKDRFPMTYDPFVDPVPIYDYDWYDYTPTVTWASDAEIREQIESELWWSPFVDSDEVNVSVEGGVATLTGTVDSWSEYRAARDNAFEGGAIWVDNDLVVVTTEESSG